MTTFRKITLVPASVVPTSFDDPFLPIVPNDDEPQEYFDPEYDPNDGCMSDNGYWDTPEDDESEESLWEAAGCPTDADISEFFARQRCD